MLIELSIKDFAIIESLTLSFAPGLNIFTGETGAGKSIIIDAIALVLGDRASNEIIRAGKEEAQVEALFDVSGQKGFEAALNEAGIKHSENLVIKRVVQKAGRNRIYINGSLATLMTLSEIGRKLIDICGQSEHQSLTRPEEHVEILDSFGELGKLREEMAAAYGEFLDRKRELEKLAHDSKTGAERKDMLLFQINELKDAGLKDGEEEDLRKERGRLLNAGKIKGAVVEGERVLYSEPGSAIEKIGAALKALRDAARHEEKLKPVVDSIESGLYSIEDAARTLRDYSGAIEADPDALDSIESRLELISRLKKKYGPSIPDMLARKDSLEKELSNIENLDSRIKELEEAFKASRQKAVTAASNLSAARQGAAKSLSLKVVKELETLGMKGAVFTASVDADKHAEAEARLSEKGSDRVAFLIAPNPGEETKPLSRIASGGELSRIMLALKSGTAAGRVPTLIFDEIDAGIGGAVSQAVGMKLKEVSGKNQVICITHLPQIAAFSERHFSVAKENAGGRTISAVKELKNEDERVEEISKMLGGLKVTDITRKHALELMHSAGSSSARQ